MNNQTELAYCCLLKAHGKYWLLLNQSENPPCILGFKSAVEGIRYFEDGYNRCHARGFEMSASACINHITFQPSIVTFDTIEQLAAALFTGPPVASHLHNISGSFLAAEATSEKAAEIWERGEHPRLIAA